MISDFLEPLGPLAAKAVLLEILENGRVDIAPHAWVEMGVDGITIQDIWLS